MRNNKNLESDFADTENLEMTPEVEQELNKIYEEKEGIDMLNNNKIKRGTEIKTMRESLIYDLYFLKESCLMYKKYILDWKSWIESSESFEYYKETYISQEFCSEEYIKEVEKIKVEQGMCNRIVNKTIAGIEDFIRDLENSNDNMIKERVDKLVSNVRDLELLRNLYNDNLYYNSSYPDFHNAYFVCIPIYSLFSMIESSVVTIKHIINRYKNNEIAELLKISLDTEECKNFKEVISNEDTKD